MLIVSGGDQAGELFKKLVVKLVLQTNDVQMKKAYGFSFTEYIEDRKGFIQNCRVGANHIEKVVRETGIAKTTGGAVSIVSGIFGKKWSVIYPNWVTTL